LYDEKPLAAANTPAVCFCASITTLLLATFAIEWGSFAMEWWALFYKNVTACEWIKSPPPHYVVRTSGGDVE